MSTNNNRLGKEVQPIWIASNDQKGTTSSPPTISKVNGSKLQRMMSNSIEEITAMSLKSHEIVKIEDFTGFNKLQRLDLSDNKLKRLNGFINLHNLGMLNVSNNQLDGSASCEELRYLTELRTLNIGSNPKIRHLESHVIKPLIKLQAFIANNCGFTKISFLKFCPLLNTLVLSHNSLIRFPTSFSSEFSFIHLTKLSLGFNQLTTLPDLSICPNITELRVNNNQITSLTNIILIPTKLKILDLSNNLLTSWDEIEILTRLGNLTNLTLKGNPLPSPPNTFDNSSLREDVYVESHENQLSVEEKRYRHHVLSLFQILVGAENKPKVRLIVLDTKRVKMKWSHHYSDGVENPPQETTTPVSQTRGPSQAKKTPTPSRPSHSSSSSAVAAVAMAHSSSPPPSPLPHPTSKQKKKSKQTTTSLDEKIRSNDIPVNQLSQSSSPPPPAPSPPAPPSVVPPSRGAAKSHGPDLSGVVSVKILKKTESKKKRERNEEAKGTGEEGRESDSQHKKKKKQRKEEDKEQTPLDPLSLFTKVSSSSSLEVIGGGGTSQWD